MPDDTQITDTPPVETPPTDTPPVDTPASENNDWTPPEGFDTDDFDENHVLLPEKVKEKRDADKAERDKLQKQHDDMRKKLSTNAVPKDVAEYANAFKPDDKFAEIVAAEGNGIKETLSDFDTFAMENGLTVNQANAVKGELLNFLSGAGIIPDTEKIATRQKEILGDKADEIIQRNVDFVKSFDVFSKDEKAMWEMAATQGNPLVVSALDKIRVLVGKGKSSDIPGSASADGLPPDDVLFAQYEKADDAEKVRIVKQRENAGRPAKWQL